MRQATFVLLLLSCSRMYTVVYICAADRLLTHLVWAYRGGGGAQQPEDRNRDGVKSQTSGFYVKYTKRWIHEFWNFKDTQNNHFTEESTMISASMKESVLLWRWNFVWGGGGGKKLMIDYVIAEREQWVLWWSCLWKRRMRSSLCELFWL